MASSAMPPHDSIIKLANPGPPAHVIKCSLKWTKIEPEMFESTDAILERKTTL
jgi:hypothetical protein